MGWVLHIDTMEAFSSPSLPHMCVRLPTVLLSTFMPDFLYPFSSPFAQV